MTNIISSKTTKQLAFRFILQHIDYRKRCLFLQEIISLAKRDEISKHILTRFFDVPLKTIPLKEFNKN